MRITRQGAAMAMRTLLSDPMLRMLAVAILLAAFLPAAGEARDFAQAIASMAIFVLFLLNGMRINRRDVASGLAHWRFLLPLTVFVFAFMAVAGMGLSRLGQGFLPPLIAIGFLYLGALPSTVQSATSYTSLARGNVALSVVAAAILNILGVFVSVPVFLALGGSGEGAVGSEAIIRILAILVLPFAIGQLVQDRTGASAARHRHRIVWIDRFVIAIAVYVAFSGAVEQGLWGRLDVRGWTVLTGFVLLFLAFGHAGAWWMGRLVGLPRADRIAFLFAGAQKSAAIGAPLATILFSPHVAGFVVVPLLLYHLFQLVLAAPLASRLAAGPVRDDSGCSGSTRES